MPKKVMTKKPDMTIEKALQIFRQKFGGRYEVYIQTVGPKIRVIKKTPPLEWLSRSNRNKTKPSSSKSLCSQFFRPVPDHGSHSHSHSLSGGL